MDATPELVEALRNGERVRLILAANEPVSNATLLFEHLEREHGLVMGRTPHLVNGVISFTIWALNVVPREVKIELTE